MAAPPRLLPTRALAWTALVVLHSTARAQGSVELQVPDDERISVHFQATVATQRHPSFQASYSGRGSREPSDSKPTTFFFVLFARPGVHGCHLNALARISRIFKTPAFRDSLLQARGAAEIYQLIKTEDAK
jgi:hypothetical protein